MTVTAMTTSDGALTSPGNGGLADDKTAHDADRAAEAVSVRAVRLRASVHT